MSERYLIWSYEHNAWWKPDRRDYTRDIAEAGEYSHTEASEIVARANIVAIPTRFARTIAALRTPVTESGSAHDG